MSSEPTSDLPSSHVPGRGQQPSGAPVDELAESATLGDDGARYDQTTAGGKDNIRGGGEFPDPDTPPDDDAGAPGPELAGHHEHGKGQFNGARSDEPD